jgi:hypothetical protein
VIFSIINLGTDILVESYDLMMQVVAVEHSFEPDEQCR